MFPRTNRQLVEDAILHGDPMYCATARRMIFEHGIDHAAHEFCCEFERDCNGAVFVSSAVEPQMRGIHARLLPTLTEVERQSLQVANAAYRRFDPDERDADEAKRLLALLAVSQPVSDAEIQAIVSPFYRSELMTAAIQLEHEAEPKAPAP